MKYDRLFFVRNGDLSWDVGQRMLAGIEHQPSNVHGLPWLVERLIRVHKEPPVRSKRNIAIRLAHDLSFAADDLDIRGVSPGWRDLEFHLREAARIGSRPQS